MKRKTKISKTKLKKRIKKKSNPELLELVHLLKGQKKPLWQKVAKYLARPKRKAIAINVHKLGKLTKNEEIVIVPGKVLGQGELNHKLTIAAFSFSDSARKKLEIAQIISIPEMVKKLSSTKGLKVKLII